MRCEACERGACISCEPIPDPDREMTFRDCDCLHSDEQILRFEHARILLVEAQEALRASRDEACCAALRRALELLGKPVRKPPLRRLALVAKPSYAQLSGESLPEWMARKHGDRR